MSHSVWAALAVLSLLGGFPCPEPVPVLPEELGQAVAVADDPKPFLIIGHRGAPVHEAENTIPSFERALADGANALEIDLVVTKDHRVAVWHDQQNDGIAVVRQAGLEMFKYFPATPNVLHSMRRGVHKMTLAELRQHYGYAERSLFEKLVPDPDPNIRIPSLDEFATWGQQKPGLDAVFLDIKLGETQLELADVLAARIAALMANAHYEVFVMSPREPILQRMRAWFERNAPDHRARFILDMEKEGALKTAQRLKLDAISTGDTPLRKENTYMDEMEEILAEAGDAMWPIISWTINDEDQLATLVQMGVDGIITDQPALLRKQVETVWGDFAKVADALTRCWERNKTAERAVACTTGSELGLKSTVGVRALAEWVCRSRSPASPLAKDLFGCGAFDNAEVDIKVPITNSSDVVFWIDPDGKGDATLRVTTRVELARRQ